MLLTGFARVKNGLVWSQLVLSEWEFIGKSRER